MCHVVFSSVVAVLTVGMYMYSVTVMLSVFLLIVLFCACFSVALYSSLFVLITSSCVTKSVYLSYSWNLESSETQMEFFFFIQAFCFYCKYF